MLGTGFTVDSPLKVARFGVSSVMSLVDDILIEKVRRHHAKAAGEPYEPIGQHEPDARARRITAWLDFVQRRVDQQMVELRGASFDPPGELTRYFEMLPASPLRTAYDRMRDCPKPAERSNRQRQLRAQVRPGAIDVNIMTRLDRDAPRRGIRPPEEAGAALSALRGFARSTLRSSLVLSAGMNPRLYGAIADFPDFLPDEAGVVRKTLIIKVSDFRSAMTQGRFLAKRGLWVSEFRIESGLNCGGHAFATAGHLMGPILEQFRDRRAELTAELHETRLKALAARGVPAPAGAPVIRLTAQGGVGTAAEHQSLLDHYGLQAVGWGTPFLLVPEATNVDDEHLRKLAAATADDVVLGRGSPLGVPFWTLRTSASEESRRRRIEAGRPGSPCPKGYLAMNTEYPTGPLCTASRAYQKRKLSTLAGLEMPETQRIEAQAAVLEKSCICHDLGGGVVRRLGLDPSATPAVCCGPNIVNFNRVVTLQEMIDHIYGRTCLPMDPARPHMFIRELMLYVDHLESEISRSGAEDSSGVATMTEFTVNLLSGIDYYRARPELFGRGTERANSALVALTERIRQTTTAAC